MLSHVAASSAECAECEVCARHAGVSRTDLTLNLPPVDDEPASVEPASGEKGDLEDGDAVGDTTGEGAA